MVFTDHNLDTVSAENTPMNFEQPQILNFLEKETLCDQKDRNINKKIYHKISKCFYDD